jgi:hypothetical protein
MPVLSVRLQLSSFYHQVFLAMPLIIFMFYRVQVYYRKSSIEVQRLESVTRSPVFNHFAETLNGCPSIRAYDLQVE